jgi:hypothetical protein
MFREEKNMTHEEFKAKLAAAQAEFNTRTAGGFGISSTEVEAPKAETETPMGKAKKELGLDHMMA